MKSIEVNSILIIIGVIIGTIIMPAMLDPTPDLKIGISMVAGSFLTAIALIVWD